MGKIFGKLGVLFFAGVYSATFTSALASLVGAPRILMVCSQSLSYPIL